MQKVKWPSVVIFPSSVRSIPFTIPVLSSSPSSTQYRFEDSDTTTTSTAFPSLYGQSIYRTSSPFSSTTSISRHDSEPPPPPIPPSALTEERSVDQWASGSCCSEGTPVNTNRGNTINTRRADFRRTPTSRFSSETLASQRTIDLEDANLLFGIDPSLYQSTESEIDGSSSIGSGVGAGGAGRAGEEEDFYSSGGAYDESNIGRIWFSLEYDPESERLLVGLIRIRNLPNSLVTSHRDPVVRISLIPGERRWVQTKFKKKSCNPRFNEDFSFQVSVRDFAERSISLAVYGSGDRHNRHQVAYGHVIYNLCDHVYEPNERIIIWRDLEHESNMLQKSNEDAQLHLTLSYNSQLSRLNVTIHSGKNFPPSEEHDRPSNEFYVVVCLMEMSRVVKKKKTSVVKQFINFSPIFNDLFQFKVGSASLDVTTLLVTAIRHIAGHKDKPIGRLVFGSFMFARGLELDHWNAMLANEKEQISKWHTLTN